MKNKKIIRTIILILSSSNAKMGGELGAMLGQYNLNIVKFCNEFNELSKVYEKNLPIIVHLHVIEGNEFNIELRGPSTSFLAKNLSKKNSLDLLDIYKMSLIQKYNFKNNKIKSFYKVILSSLDSSSLKIIYE